MQLSPVAIPHPTIKDHFIRPLKQTSYRKHIIILINCRTVFLKVLAEFLWELVITSAKFPPGTVATSLLIVGDDLQL